ncbi:MAG: sulfite exporter TauE/SafE family protein, partial [Pseudomonadota bacterium]|nr:sulfite exporter TauE/SafE family protein [Pseudomonadota bacterium]
VGLFTFDTTQISFVGLVAMLVGLKLGIPIRRRLSESSFRRAVLGLLMLLGAGLVLRPLL